MGEAEPKLGEHMSGKPEQTPGGAMAGAPHAASVERPSPPAIPDYELLRPVGQGSYGQVWLARSLTGVYRAVKVVPRLEADQGRSFEREYRGIQLYEPISLEASSLMDILHVGRNDQAEYFYYVMELADDAGTNPGFPGSDEPARRPILDPERYVPRTLRLELQRKGPMPVQDCARLGIALCRALERLHASGVAHRDVKPANIIFVNGQPKLTDIGLVAPAEAGRSWVGTPGYVPPEGPGKPQADVFSLGKVLYETSTGLGCDQYPEPPTHLGTPANESAWAELNEIILKACAPDPARRYGSAAALEADLRLLLGGGSVRRLQALERRHRQMRRIALATLVSAAILAAGWLYQRVQVNRLRDLAEANRRNVVRLHLANGFRQVDEADVLGALPWFIAASRQDAGSADKEAIHRLRIGMTYDQCVRTAALGAHTDAINDSSFSPDGQRVVTASRDGTARVWDVATGEPVTPPMKHGDSVFVARFSQDGKRVLTAGKDGIAQVWDTATGQRLGEPLRHADSVDYACFGLQDRRILTAGRDGVASVWETETGRQLAFMKHKARIQMACFSPDGSRIVTASNDATGRVWDAATGAALSAPLTHRTNVYCVAFSPDGRYVATGSSDATARIWETATGRPVTPPLRHSGSVWHVEFSPDGTLLLSSGGAFRRTGEARLWQVATSDPVGQPFRHSQPVGDAEFSPDGRWIATAGADGTARVWDAATGEPVTPPLRHDNSVWNVAFSPDGEGLLTSSRDGVWRLWSLRARDRGPTELAHAHGVASAAISPDGQIIVTSGDHWQRLWDARSFRVIQSSLPGRLSGIIRFSADGRVLAFGQEDQVELWKFEDGSSTPRFWRSLAGRGRMDLTLSGRGLAAVTDTTNVVLYPNLSSGTNSFLLRHSLPVHWVQFSMDGRWLVSGSGNKSVRGQGAARVWNARTGEAQTPWLASDGVVDRAAFSPDGRLVICDCTDPTSEPRAARVWDVQTGQAASPPLWHRDGVTAVAFSHRGDLVVTGGEDGVARMWALATWQPVGEAMRHQRGVGVIRFSADDRLVLTGSTDGTARVWEAGTGFPVSPPLRHPAAVNECLFSPDGRWVLTAGESPIAHVWRLSSLESPLEQLEGLAEVHSGFRVTADGVAVATPAAELPSKLADVRRHFEASGKGPQR